MHAYVRENETRSVREKGREEERKIEKRASKQKVNEKSSPAAHD